MTTKTEAVPLPLWDTNGVTIEGLNALREATPAGEIKQRVAPGGSGKMLDYVDARFVMDRLDVMAGPQNWQDRYEDVPNVSPPAMRCYLRIKVLGEWIEKADVGDASTIEPTKGASSDAFKRAAVKWGIARDLYDAREDAATPVQRGTYQQPAPVAAPTAQRAPTRAVNGTPGIAAINPTSWVCPVHGAVKVVPEGISARTGRPYSAFIACPERGCDQKPPRVTTPVYVEEPLPYEEGA